MNEQYEQTIEVNGRIYRYDPDYDCYYRVPVQLSTFDKYAWIVVILALVTIITLMGWWNR
jgi:hypothetical protein